MTALLLKYWKPLTIAGAVLLAVGIFNVWLSSAKSAAYERGYAAADMECRKAREAAQQARDAQIEAIRKEEARKLAEMEAERDAERERNAELERRLTDANRAAQRARREAERLADEALNTDGLAGCLATDGVSDTKDDGLSAYRTRHGQRVH